jgi:hypothetical protein
LRLEHPRSRVHITLTCCAARIRRRAARRAERGAQMRPSGSANFRRRIGRAAPHQPHQSRLTRRRRPHRRRWRSCATACGHKAGPRARARRAARGRGPRSLAVGSVEAISITSAGGPPCRRRARHHHRRPHSRCRCKLPSRVRLTRARIGEGLAGPPEQALPVARLGLARLVEERVPTCLRSPCAPGW